MTHDSLTELWNSPANRPAPYAGERLAVQLVARMRKRRRWEALRLGWVFFALTAMSSVAVVALTRHGTAGLTGQWSLIPLLLLPWWVAVYFLRDFIHASARSLKLASPLRDVLKAAQIANATERRHLRLTGWFFAITLPMTALAVWQLQATGKTPGNQAWSMAFVFGVVFTLGAAGLVVRYRRYLLPEQRTLEARRRELDDVITD